MLILSSVLEWMHYSESDNLCCNFSTRRRGPCKWRCIAQPVYATVRRSGNFLQLLWCEQETPATNRMSALLKRIYGYSIDIWGCRARRAMFYQVWHIYGNETSVILTLMLLHLCVTRRSVLRRKCWNGVKKKTLLPTLTCIARQLSIFITTGVPRILQWREFT